MISNPYSSRNEIVGTTKMSSAAIPSAWLQRNVFHPCEGGALLRAIYLATLVWPISTPSLRSSPWILGAGMEDIPLQPCRRYCRDGYFRRALAIVRPDTVIRWHRAGFRSYWPADPLVWRHRTSDG